MRIAFITCAKKPSITDDDMVLSDELIRAGCVVDGVPWDSKVVHWRAYDLLLIRSTWDYHVRSKEFDKWLTFVKENDLPVLNPPEVIRWNMNKKYLLELKEKGIAIPKGVFIPVARCSDAIELVRSVDADRLVVKPAVSATAFQTHLISRDDLLKNNSLIEEVFNHGDVIVQEFLPEIETKGEISMIYVRGKFSHAVLKQAKPGDFRVQNEFGGTVRPFSVSESIRKQADRIIQQMPDCLYARVDGVEVKSEFILMELELIEPVLFFRESPDAARQMANAILA